MKTPNGIDDALAHHAANAAAVVIPVASVTFHLPEVITVLVGILGIIWYAILIGEKIARWRAQWKQTRQSTGRVAVKELEERHDNYTPPSAD